MTFHHLPLRFLFLKHNVGGDAFARRRLLPTESLRLGNGGGDILALLSGCQRATCTAINPAGLIS